MLVYGWFLYNVVSWGEVLADVFYEFLAHLFGGVIHFEIEEAVVALHQLDVGELVCQGGVLLLSELVLQSGDKALLRFLVQKVHMRSKVLDVVLQVFYEADEVTVLSEVVKLHKNLSYVFGELGEQDVSVLLVVNHGFTTQWIQIETLDRAEIEWIMPRLNQNELVEDFIAFAST